MSAHRDRGLERMREQKKTILHVKCFFIYELNFISLMVLAFKKYFLLSLIRLKIDLIINYRRKYSVVEVGKT